MLRGVDSGGIEGIYFWFKLAMCEAGHVSVINLHENPEVKQEIKSLYKQRWHYYLNNMINMKTLNFL